MTEYELYHAGVKGMKWGVRRYQNKDGTLTDAGKKRYGEASRDSTGKGAVKKFLSSFGNRPYSSVVGEKKPKFNWLTRGMTDGYTPPSKRQQNYIDRHGFVPPKQKHRGGIH